MRYSVYMQSWRTIKFSWSNVVVFITDFSEGVAKNLSNLVVL